MNKALILLVFVCAAVAFDYKTALQKANVSQRRDATTCDFDSLVGNYEISNPSTTFKYAKEGVTYKMRRSTDEAVKDDCAVVDEKNLAAFATNNNIVYALVIAKDEAASDANTFACAPKDNEDNKVMYQCTTTVESEDGTSTTATMDFTKVSNGVLRHGIAVAVLAIVAVVALLL